MMRWMLVGGMVGGGLWCFREVLAIAIERRTSRYTQREGWYR